MIPLKWVGMRVEYELACFDDDNYDCVSAVEHFAEQLLMWNDVENDDYVDGNKVNYICLVFDLLDLDINFDWVIV